MVHLGKVVNDKEANQDVLPGLKKLDLGGQDEFTASVYGSKFAAADLPKHEMPDNEMPREVAYRLIKYVRLLFRKLVLSSLVQA